MNKIKFGFQKHLNKTFPSQVTVDLTQFCNLACIHCPHPVFIKSDAYSGAHLDLNLHKKLIDEVASDGHGICQYIRYTANGEPLLHPKFDEMIKYAGRYSKTKINVTTNGVLLTERRSKLMLDAGVNVFDISLDAYYEETYKKIRPASNMNIKGNFIKIRQNILDLIDLIENEKYNSKIVVSFVEQPLNTNETKLFENYWNEAGVSFVVIRRLHSAAGAKDDVKKMMEIDLKDVVRKPCLYPWERLVLTPEGDLSFCPASWTGESHFAKFKDATIRETWQGDFMNSLRKAHLDNNYDCFGFCEQCPDWVNTKWPEEYGVNYSDMMSKIVPIDLL
jgi:sulfatase maturation enzyme AslB (radical SAM superfamily)